MQLKNKHHIAPANLHSIRQMAQKWVCFVAMGACLNGPGCRNPAPPSPSALPAFYHWKTHLNPSHEERQLMDSLGVTSLYVKFFDIDLNEQNQPVPLAELEADTASVEGLRIVPTVFITNRTFKHIERSDIQPLAERVMAKIETLCAGLPCFQQGNSANEWQFDCDWTESTREHYFYFLHCIQDNLKDQRPARNNQDLAPPLISATIRLHQFKYPDRTGVPPVDKGMLMCYNTGDLESWETENALLDLATAKQYLMSARSPYPLHLDVALPVFKWGVVFRNGELAYLINNLQITDLQEEARFQKLKENRFEVMSNTYLDGHFLYKGDLIRLEGVTPGSLHELAKMLSNRLPNLSDKAKIHNRMIAFYHLDSVAMTGFFTKDFVNVLSVMED